MRRFLDSDLKEQIIMAAALNDRAVYVAISELVGQQGGMPRATLSSPTDSRRSERTSTISEEDRMWK